jgi:hypothetical protein
MSYSCEPANIKVGGLTEILNEAINAYCDPIARA